FRQLLNRLIAARRTGMAARAVCPDMDPAHSLLSHCQHHIIPAVDAQRKATALIENHSVSKKLRTYALYIFHAIAASTLFIDCGQEPYIPVQLPLPFLQPQESVKLHHRQLLRVQSPSAPDAAICRLAPKYR